MTRKEYQLVFEALKSYKTFMTDQEKVLSEKILDDLYYSREVKDRKDTDRTGQDFREESKGITQEMVDASLKTPMWYEKEDNNDEIKSLNFR